MKKTLVIFLSMVLFVALGAPVFAADEAAAPAAPATLVVGSMLTDDLMATTLDGSTVKLKDVLGSDYTFFQFMTTACSACQAELQEFIGMKAEMGDKIKIVSISMDLMGAAAVNAYEAKFKYGVEYLLDTEFKLPPRFNFAYTPSFFAVDKDGKIVFTKGGFMQSRWAKDRKKLEAAMQ